MTCILLSFLTVIGCSLFGSEPVKPPMRIISLMPSNTEILFDLGMGDCVVGVTSYCDYPEAARKIEIIGNFIHPNVEKIVSLKPDIVFGGKWQSSQIVPRLRRTGLNVVEINLPATLEEIYGTITQIAKLVGREKEGNLLVARLRQRVEKITEKTGKRNYRPKIYIDVDTPNWTVSKHSFISDAVERCGSINIFRDLPVAGAQVSFESIVEKDPEVILVSATRRNELIHRPGWHKISAIKNNRIVDDIDKNLMNRPTPRIVLGMEKLAQRLSRMKFE